MAEWDVVRYTGETEWVNGHIIFNGVERAHQLSLHSRCCNSEQVVTEAPVSGQSAGQPGGRQDCLYDYYVESQAHGVSVLSESS